MDKIKNNRVYIYSYTLAFIILGILFYILIINVKNNAKPSNYSANLLNNNSAPIIEDKWKSLIVKWDYKEAVEHFEEKKDTASYEEQILLVRSYLNYGNSYYIENEFADKALALLVNMEEKYETLYYKWYAYEIKQDYDKALEYYNKAKDLKNLLIDEKTIILNQIWHVHDLKWDFVKANELYTESEKLWYENMGTIINRWRSEFRLNNYDKAKEYFEKILSMSDNKFTRAEMYYNISNIYLAKNDYKKVIEYAKLWIETSEKYPNNYIILWMAYIRDWWTKIDEAPELFKEAIKIYPNSSVAYKWLWIYYYIKDDFDNAIINFEKQYETSSNNIILMKNDKDKWKLEAIYDLWRVYALKNNAWKSVYYLNQVLDWKNIDVYSTFIQDIAFKDGPFWLVINQPLFMKNAQKIFNLYKK